MSRTLLTIVALVSSAGVAHGQGKFGDLTMSTDPARAAAVEQQAADLKAQEDRRMSHPSRHTMRHHARHVAGNRHSQNQPATKG